MFLCSCRTTPSRKYATRTNSGEVVFRFNEDGGSCDWKSNDARTVRVEKIVNGEVKRHMCFDLVDYLDWADMTIDRLSAAILDKFSLEEAMPVKFKHPVRIFVITAHIPKAKTVLTFFFFFLKSSFVTFGRIACDSDGRLNSKSVILEGSRDLSLGELVQLDLTSVSKYSIFPGQVVAVEGHNVTGDRLVAKELYSELSEAAPPLPSLPEGE